MQQEILMRPASHHTFAYLVSRHRSEINCLIRSGGLGEVLAADETVSFDLARLRLVEELSREPIRLGRQGLLSAQTNVAPLQLVHNAVSRPSA